MEMSQSVDRESAGHGIMGWAKLHDATRGAFATRPRLARLDLTTVAFLLHAPRAQEEVDTTPSV